MFSQINVNENVAALFTEPKKEQPVIVPVEEVEPEQEEDVVEHKSRRDKKKELSTRNKRTCFVGNVPVQVSKKPKHLKQLFEQFGEIESVRFRSIAFSDKLPRKVAFMAGKFHEGRDSVNAYIVFKEQEAAEKAVSLNGHVFEGHHLRVDTSEKEQQQSTQDTKRSIFLGNLPFDIQDEDLWKLFEDLPVEYIRVIRDRKTNVGKGIGYVQFKEKSAISLALKLNETEIKGRKIRITRAKEDKPVVEGTRATKPAVVKEKIKAAKDRSTRVSKKTDKPVKVYGGSNTVPRPRTTPKKPRHVPRPKPATAE